MEYQYEHDGATYSVRLDIGPDGETIATIGDERYLVESNDKYLRIDGQQVRAVTAQSNAPRQEEPTVYVALDGRTYELKRVTDSGTRRRGSGAKDSGLTAQMPGQVTGIQVAEGDRVEKGQTLLMLEAMKMEIKIAAPCNGTVRQILVKIGETVDRSQQLIDIEEG